MELRNIESFSINTDNIYVNFIKGSQTYQKAEEA